MKNIIIILVLVLLAGSVVWVGQKKAKVDPLDATALTGEAVDLSGLPASGTFSIDVEKSVINGFGRKPLLANYTDQVTLKIKSGKVEAKDGVPVSGEVVIDMNSLAAVSTGKGSGESMLTNHLKSADFFDVAKHAEAKFVAKGASKNSTSGFDLTGDLTIKGITKAVVIPVRIAAADQATVTVVGKVEIDRTLWDIRYGSGKFFQNLGDKIIDDMFTVEFEAVFVLPTITKTDNQNKIMQATFKTSKGDITIEFLGEQAPNTVANFTKLAGEGFYNGVKFHRVIKGFMIQGGDPLTKDDSQMARWGSGGPGYQFADEITPTNSNDVGTISMANAGPNTNGSQFFINTANNSFLNPKHTVFGKVVKGMEVVTAIENVATAPGDRPVEAVVINSITLN